MSEWDRINDFKVVSEPVLLAAWISRVSNISVEATVPTNLSLVYIAAGLLLVGYFCRKIKALTNLKFIGFLCMVSKTAVFLLIRAFFIAIYIYDVFWIYVCLHLLGAFRDYAGGKVFLRLSTKWSSIWL